MEFASFVSVLAILIALGALWLASDALRRLDAHSQSIVNAHVKPVRTEVDKISDKLHSLQKAVASIDKLEKNADERFSAYGETLEALKADVSLINKDLEALDQSIPGRYRTKVATPPAKAKDTPSIQ